MTPTTPRWQTVARYAVATVLCVGWFILPSEPLAPGWVIANVLGLVLGLVAMRWRHRYPVAVAVATSLALAFLPVVWPLAAWAYVSLCTHRRWGATVGAGLVHLAALCVEPVRGAVEGVEMEPGEVTPWASILATAILFAMALTVALAAVGSYLGARRAEAAARAEQMRLIEERSRSAERDRIAIEMHDVLAHKLTLVSMHAGALAYRTDLTPDEVRASAETIQTGANAALDELRVILGRLRQKDGDVVAAPQPTLAGLPALVAEHVAAGRKVTLADTRDGDPSEAVSRQAYRVVQEGLTNAAKHAPGTRVVVEVSGKAGDGLTVRVTNPIPVGPAGEGSRLGLVGVEERMDAVGGRMRAGECDGNFELEVWMPW